MNRPRWAGAPSFSGAWDAAASVVQGANLGLANLRADAGAVASETLKDLERARVLRFPHAQAEVLPLLCNPAVMGLLGNVDYNEEAETLCTYMAQVRPPFPVTFLDFEDLPLGLWTESLAAALLVADESGRLSRIRFFQKLTGYTWRVDATFETDGEVADVKLLDTCPFDVGTSEKDATLVGSYCLERTIAALFFLDAANIELAKTTLTRQQRRHAERTEALISDTVVIRQTKRRIGGSAGGDAREFSHRFEVRGHYHHVTQGPHVVCRDCQGEGWLQQTDQVGGAVIRTACETCQATGHNEHVKPCPVHGMCRREWHAPSVRGPEDKPLIPKQRVLERLTGDSKAERS